MTKIRLRRQCVAYKVCRVEIAGFEQHSTEVIDVSDYFIDLGEIADKVRKEITHGTRYDERDLHDTMPPQYLHDQLEMQKQPDAYEPAMRVMIQAQIEEEVAEFEAATEFIRITDDH